MVNDATNKEWRGMKPPKGRHWRSEPKVLEQLEKEDLIEWSANGVPRRKIYIDERNGKLESASGRMTLVFKQIGKDWKIIHIHTSPDNPDATRPVLPSEREN